MLKMQRHLMTHMRRAQIESAAGQVQMKEVMLIRRQGDIW